MKILTFPFLTKGNSMQQRFCVRAKMKLPKTSAQMIKVRSVRERAIVMAQAAKN